MMGPMYVSAESESSVLWWWYESYDYCCDGGVSLLICLYNVEDIMCLLPALP